MGSTVGPEVTSARRPESGSGPLPRTAASKWAAIAARISSGSAMRPAPVSPQAKSPRLGPMRRTPRPVRMPMLVWVAGCSHMALFIAGATSTGLSVASSAVEARSSASPAAILARRSAVAGATTTRSALRDSRIWPISDSSVRENRS